MSFNKVFKKSVVTKTVVKLKMLISYCALFLKVNTSMSVSNLTSAMATRE